MKKFRTRLACWGGALIAMFFLHASFHVAHAADPVAHSAEIFGAEALPCVSKATQLMSNQLNRMTPDQLLNGMRPEADKGSWKRGDPKYDRARVIVVEALSAEERAGGPVINISAEQVLLAVVASWSAEEQRYYSAFFSSPAGKLYLTDILDGATCTGWIKGLNSPPLLPMDGVDKAQWDDLMGGLKGGADRFVGKMRGLSKVEKDSFETGSRKLGSVFDVALKRVGTSQDAEIKRRLEKAIAPRMCEILEIQSSP